MSRSKRLEEVTISPNGSLDARGPTFNYPAAPIRQSGLRTVACIFPIIAEPPGFTSGTVKLLLPPRQSRGSPIGLGDELDVGTQHSGAVCQSCVGGHQRHTKQQRSLGDEAITQRIFGPLPVGR